MFVSIAVLALTGFKNNAWITPHILYFLCNLSL